MENAQFEMDFGFVTHPCGTGVIATGFVSDSVLGVNGKRYSIARSPMNYGYKDGMYEVMVGDDCFAYLSKDEVLSILDEHGGVMEIETQ